MKRRLFSKPFLSLVAASSIAVGVLPQAALATPLLQDGYTSFVTTDNWGGGSVGNETKDDDLDSYTPSPSDSSDGADIRKKYDPKSGSMIKNGTAELYPFEFKIPVPADKLPHTSAYLLIRGYDVDEEAGEWDRVYLSKTPLALTASSNLPNGYTEPESWGNTYKKSYPLANYVGALSGNNVKWNTTVFKLNLDQVSAGDNYVGISVHSNPKVSSFNSGWETAIDWGQLILDGGSRTTGELKDVNVDVVNGKVTVNTSVQQNGESSNFLIEANVIDKDGNNIATEVLKVPAENDGRSLQIQLNNPAIDASKEYTVNIILFDEEPETTGPNAGVPGLVVPTKAEHLYSITTNQPTVGNIAKTGFQYDPTVFEANDFKNQYFVNNNVANGEKLEKIQIKSLPSATMGKLQLNGTDVVLNQEILKANLGQLKFVPVAAGFTGVVTFDWNGYNGTRYAETDATVTITANAAPVVDNISKSANKGSEIPFTLNDFEQVTVDSDALTKVKITTLPATGTLVWNNNPVTIGQEIPAAELDKLKFVPAEGQTSGVSFEWNGFDGNQYAKDAKLVLITINTPPTVSLILKAGLTGETIAFSENDFVSHYQDLNSDLMTKVKIILPSGFDQKGTLWYTGVTSAVYLPAGSSTELTNVNLDSLKFSPAAELPNGSSVSFNWLGFDGKQYAETAAAVTISYNGKPIAEPQTVKVEQGNPSILIHLTGNDPETITELVYGIVSQPAKGTLTPTSEPGIYTFTPNADYEYGQDSFTFTVTDGDGQVSQPATVTIQINRTLDGWVGDKVQSDMTKVKALPGEPLLLRAVSSLLADQVTATINGTAQSLTLMNASTALADGYKLWEKTNFVLSQETQAGSYEVAFSSVQGTTPLPAETVLANNRFEVIPAILKLTANPDKIVGDGNSKTELQALLTDEDGNPIQGVEVTFTAPAGIGSFIGSNKAITNSLGIATVIYKSSKITSDMEQNIPVKANVHDLERSLAAEDEIQIVFQPAVISGVITQGGTNQVVAGATVRITLDLNGDHIIDAEHDFIRTVVTDEHGAYSVPVPQGDKVYDLEFTQLVNIGGNPTPITYKQKAEVGSITGGGDEEFNSVKTVTGIVLLKSPTGDSNLLSDEAKGKTKVYLKDQFGNYTVAPLQANGVFNAEGLTIGSYSMEVRYELAPGQEIVIKRSNVTVLSNGEMNIAEELIDPYGTVTDAVTNAVISGAKVTLYYANSTRNGVKGGTQVTLPAIPGFDPNNNASPEQSTDVNGLYAYMVYPNTDYYLVVEKSGYDTYVSPMIPVNADIVRHDIKMNRPSTDNGYGGPARNPVTLSLSVDKNQVEEGTTSSILVDYKNTDNFSIHDGVITVQLPTGLEVTDADGGKVDGNTITWQITDLAVGKSGNYTIVVKWPQLTEANKEFAIPGVFKAGQNDVTEASSNVKVNVFSNRFGNLQHQRYILGYPDNQFKPNNSLTRAELAAIVARLTENQTLNDALPYKDVSSSHWAANYIKIVTKHDYFSGYADGNFRPEAPVTRGELASVMTRFLKLSVSDPTNFHFTDVKEHWAAAAIEQLYGSKFLSGYPDATFKPNDAIRRVEAVTMINRMLYRGPLKGVNALFPDVSSDHWGFGDVQEATFSHEATRNLDASEQWKSNLKDDVQ